jgi:hypothetical protein
LGMEFSLSHGMERRRGRCIGVRRQMRAEN